MTKLVAPVVVNLCFAIAREIECEGGRKRVRGGQMEVIGIRLFLLFPSLNLLHCRSGDFVNRG